MLSDSSNTSSSRRVLIRILRFGAGRSSFLFAKRDHFSASLLPIVDIYPVDAFEVGMGLDFLGVQFATPESLGRVALKELIVLKVELI